MTGSLAAGPVSMMHGWLPATVEAIAIVAVTGSIVGRPRRWCAVWGPPTAVLGALTAWAAHRFMTDFGIASEPAPWRLWGWVAVFAGAAALVVIGWPGSRWFRRNLTVFAASMCLLSAGLTINGWIGYFPTVSIAWNQLTGGPLPGETDRATVATMQSTGMVPSRGVLVKVTIDADASRFTHRDEWVYLPPAWFATDPPPRLPAVMMIGGEFHTSADWVRAGNAVSALDAFAADHAGTAPVAVFVDSSGAFTVDTECVNGPRGNAADHLTKDVVPYLVDEFGVSAEQSGWGVAGFSSGGTCALDLAVMHPELFHAFVDIAGDVSPNAGTEEQTIDRLFGGDREAWSSFDPVTVIKSHSSSYHNVSGLIVAPDGSAPTVSSGSDTLCALGRSRQMTCDVVTLDGRHDWPSAASAFAATLPWLAAQLGVDGVRDPRPPQSTKGLATQK